MNMQIFFGYYLMWTVVSSSAHSDNVMPLKPQNPQVGPF